MKSSFLTTIVARIRIEPFRRQGCKLAYGGTGSCTFSAHTRQQNARVCLMFRHVARFFGGLPLRLERGFLRHAAGFEHLPGDVEAYAEVVDEVEEREGPKDGIWIRHLDEDGDVAEKPERGERQGELAEGACARRVDVPDGYEDQERADEQYCADGGCSKVEDDEVERRYVPIAREAQEEVVRLGIVPGLGVHAAKLVARREDGDGRQGHAERPAGKVPGAPQKEDGGENVGHVVHDVVEEAAVEGRQEL